MTRQSLRPLVLVAVGVVLLLNPVYLYPDGVPEERNYTFEAERTEEIDSLARSTDSGNRILQCGSGTGPYEHRACAFESLVGPNGTLTLANRTVSDGGAAAPELHSRYEYVYYFGTGFYRPDSRVGTGSVTLTLEPVTARAVAENVSIPYRTAPDGVRRAIATGNATVTVRMPPGASREPARAEALDTYVGSPGRLVLRNGTFYVVGASVRSEPAVPPIALDLARIAAVLVGLGLAYLAVRRQRRPHTTDPDPAAGE